MRRACVNDRTTKELESDQSNTVNTITVYDLGAAIAEYKKKRGWGRFLFGDQETIQTLDTFYHELLHNDCNTRRKLSANEAFTVINMMVNNDSLEQNSASSKALEFLEKRCCTL